jgi:predicted NBD/HSP70 family sugar kinase
MLSSELSTLLTGRHRQIHLTPLSFKELARAEKGAWPENKQLWFAPQADTARRQLLTEYKKYGGFPRAFVGKDISILSQYFEDIIIKDIDLPFDKILGAGIGITGRVNAKKGISYSFLNLDIPLMEYLSNIWGIPVFIENDTHLLALAEIHYGLAKDLTNVISVNLSKGLAVSIISNGQLQTGYSGFAGEFGHIFAENNNKICVCGKSGCLETLVSGLAIESFYNVVTGKVIDYKELLNSPELYDFPMSEYIQKMGEQLGKSLAVLIDLLNPELIIIGGGFIPVLDSMRFSINKGINLHSLPQLAADCEIKISSLGENAAMYGAFALVTENLLTT